MYLIANTIINIFWLLPLFFFTCTCIIFILISFTILYFIYGECIENGLYYTIKLIWAIFSSLPFLLRLYIIIRLIFFVYLLFDFSLDYTLNSGLPPVRHNPTIPKNNPPFDPGGDGLPSLKDGPQGKNLPPLKTVLPEQFYKDELTKICGNQLNDVTSGKTIKPIFHERHTYSSTIPDRLKGEFLERYIASGNTESRVVNNRLVSSSSMQSPSIMSQKIFDAIKRD